VRWRARTIVQQHRALRASRPQLKRDPLGSHEVRRTFARVANSKGCHRSTLLGSKVTKGTILLVALGLLGVVAYCRMRVTPEQLRRRIERELPLGSRSGKVLAFLDSLQTEHSDVSPSHYSGSTTIITAAIRGVRKGNLLADGIFMEFHFDDKDALIRYTVKYGYTWP